MLNIAIISLAIGNLALVYGFMWMNRRIRLIEKKSNFVFRMAHFHTPEETIVLTKEQIISLSPEGDRHE